VYLVDTNVVSAGAPSKHAAPADLVAWMIASSDRLFLSVVTAAEVKAGIAKAIREGARAKAATLLEWWGAVEHLYGERILPIDLSVAHAAGEILDGARGARHKPDFADVAIAATARVHGLSILTRNVRNFVPLRVPFLNPFERLPSPAQTEAPAR
jgi:predicted nucleic acid-binding protein